MQSKLSPLGWARLTAACVLLPLSCLANPFTVDELGKMLVRSEARSVPYVERQYRKILKTPIEQRGELIFEPPATFEKHVLQPTEQRYRLMGNTLSIESGGQAARQYSTRNQPVIRGLMAGFQAVASGDLTTLAKYYHVTLSGNAAAWQLDLAPIDAQLARYIDQVLIAGSQSELQKFEVIEKNGDRSVTEIKY